MDKARRLVFIVLSYIVAFVVSAIISGLVINNGKIGGNLDIADSRLPLLYVRAGGQLINEMHGFTTNVDAGYYRDSMTPVGDSKTVNLCIEEGGYDVVSASYALYNDRYTEELESGDCSDITRADASWQTQVVFKETLQSNMEYILKVTLKNREGRIADYFTRVHYGSDLKLAEKLEFVMDFNETTFEEDSDIQLANYLESKTTAGSNLANVTIYSAANLVTWGYLNPYRISELSIRLKEINTETAAFTVAYQVESDEDDLSMVYDVTEYYRLRYVDEGMHLLYFERSVEEDMTASDITVNNGMLRVGIGDASKMVCESFGTEDQTYCYLVRNGQLWLYDCTSRTMTAVYTNEENNHNCTTWDDEGIKVIHEDPASGDLDFLVYGYMHSGDFEGQEGITIYHFTHEDVSLSQMMFIPYEKGFVQLQDGINELAFMNDDGELYLRVEKDIYRINVALGRMETAWEDLSSENYYISGTGVLAMAQGVEDSTFGDSILVLDMNTGQERTISGGSSYIMPLGYAEEDLVYGLIPKELAVEDSTGVVQTPVNELYIVDADLKVKKVYTCVGDLIIDTNIKGSNISMTLGKGFRNGTYTDYRETGEDYIFRNIAQEESKCYLVSDIDGSRGTENWIYLDSSASFEPVVQNARLLDPGYDITQERTASADAVDLAYYVYTKGRLDQIYDNMQDAVDYVDSGNYGGTIMSSTKQILWQRAGRAYVWDLNIYSIEQSGKSLQSINKVLANAIADYEGWDVAENVNWKAQTFVALSEALPGTMIDLTGMDMGDILQLVYRGHPVVVKTGLNTFGLITAYDENLGTVVVADPLEGDTTWYEWYSAESLFEDAGSVYYGYLN